MIPAGDAATVGYLVGGVSILGWLGCALRDRFAHRARRRDIEAIARVALRAWWRTPLVPSCPNCETLGAVLTFHREGPGPRDNRMRVGLRCKGCGRDDDAIVIIRDDGVPIVYLDQHPVIRCAGTRS